MPSSPFCAPLIAEARAWCVACAPAEGVGVIVRTPVGLRVHPLRNVSADPRSGFEVDPLEWARVEDQAVVFFHSHPNGAAGLSARDRAALPRSIEHWVFAERLSRHRFVGGQWIEFTGKTK